MYISEAIQYLNHALSKWVQFEGTRARGEWKRKRSHPSEEV